MVAELKYFLVVSYFSGTVSIIPMGSEVSCVNYGLLMEHINSEITHGKFGKIRELECKDSEGRIIPVTFHDSKGGDAQ